MRDATKNYEEWQSLCDERVSACDAFLKAFDVVSQKFMAVAQGESNTNPSDTELSEFEKTWQALEDIKKRIDEKLKTI